jgi:hypothetical protein
MKTPFLALAFLLPLAAFAAGPLTDGARVRVASSSIEPGWFTGKVRIDERGCWMVHLDKATKDRYTLLALLVVNRLEVATSGSQPQSWTPIDPRPLIEAQPKQCLEEGAD